MFSTFLQELRGYLGKGYLLAVFAPTLIVAGLALGVGLEVTIGMGAALHIWAELPLEAQLLLSFGALSVIACAAYFIHNLQLAITRLFEGYWEGTLLWPLYRPRQRLYQAEFDFLEQRRIALEQALQPDLAPPNSAILRQVARLFGYWSRLLPPPGHRELIQPTRLGNVLRAGELYAQDHYGIDAVVIWPRLRPLLPANVVTSLQERKTAMDFMLLMAIYAGGFTVLACPAIALFSTRWDLLLLCALGLPLAAFCYRNAVQTAVAYSEQLRATFDLYRGDLLRALALKIPTEPEQERALWETLSRFYQSNIPPTPAGCYQAAYKAENAYQYLERPSETPPGTQRRPRLRSRQGKPSAGGARRDGTG